MSQTIQLVWKGDFRFDGTARGGILVAIAEKTGLPVHFIGVGEGVEDLAPFSAHDFARAIAGSA